MRAPVLLLFACVLSLTLVRRAEACASCGSGDPTLTALGAEQPFAGRLRSSVELSYRTDAIGSPGVDQLDVQELRADAATAWAPIDTLFVLATVPLVHRRTRSSSLATNEAWGVGDIELRAKGFVYRDRAFAPRWLVAVASGLKLPTAPWLSDASGERLPLEAQPGTGSLDVLLAPSLAIFQGKFSAYASLQWSVPITTREPLEPGCSLRGSLALQHQAWTWLALRAAVDGRWDAPTHERGEPDPNSGGWILFAGADALVSPAIDLSVALGIRWPVLNELHGAHEEGPRVAAALIRDW